MGPMPNHVSAYWSTWRRAAWGVSQMLRLLLLDNGWPDCVEIWHAIESHLVVVHALVVVPMQWSRLGYLRTCARAHRASISQERLGRLCSNCGVWVRGHQLRAFHKSLVGFLCTCTPHLFILGADWPIALKLFVARGPIVTKLTTISKENHSLIHSIYYTTTTWQEHEQIFLSGMSQAPRVQRRQVSRQATCFGIANVSDDARSNSIRTLQDGGCSLLH